MKISEKQLMELMNIARVITLERNVSFCFQNKVADLILEIENQQSEELKDIE